MKSKSRKSLKLATIIGASLLLTAGVAATLSSCVVTWKDGYFPIARPDDNGNVSQLNKKNEIDWKKVKRGEQKLIIDNGLVFKDKAKTELIAVVPQGALSSSQSLKSNDVVIPSSVKKISYYTEISRDANGNRVKTIRGAFENNNFITSVNLGKVKTIEGPIFKGATSLTKVDLGPNITEIPNSAFEGTTKLNTIKGSERIVKIGDLAFKNSFSTLLNGAKITLTLKDVTHIGTSAFERTTQLQTITFNDNSSPLSLSPSTFKSSGITRIDLSSRSLNDSSLPPDENNQPNNSLPASTFEGASSLTSFTLPTNITSIGADAFKGTGLRDLSLANYSSLTSIGENAFADTPRLTTFTLPNSITRLEAGFLTNSNVQTVNLANTRITDIPTGTLSGLRNLTTINLPTNITTIGDRAFAENPKLANIDLDSKASLTSVGAGFLNGTKVTSVNLSASTNMTSLSPRAFLNNTTVTNVTLPTSVTSIGDSAFEGASKLNALNLPTSVQSIGASAFKNCTKVNTQNLSTLNQLQTIGDSAFENLAANITTKTLNLNNLPATLTSIGNNAFKGANVNNARFNTAPLLETIGDSAFENTKITDVDLSNSSSLTSIGASAFKGISTLTTVHFSSNSSSGGATTSLQTIGNSAFEGTRLNRVDLSKATSLQTIGANAFKGSESSKTINTISLPNSVTSIGNQAFRYAGAQNINLTTLSNLNTIGEGAFADNTRLNNLQLPMNANLDIQDGAFYKTTALQRINLPNTLTEIKQGVFAESGLTQLNLDGKSVNTIGQGAFFKSKLASLDLSTNNNVTTIEDSAFAENIALATVKLPNSLTTLGARAFAKSNNNGFNTIDLKDTKLTTLSNETFKETSITTVTLPKTLTSIGENVFGTANNSSSLVTNVTWEPTTATTLPDNFYDEGNFGSVENLTLKGKISTLPSTNVPGGIMTVNLSDATNLRALPASAFENTILKTITLPNNLNTIGQNAFKRTYLAKLDLSSTKVTSIPDGLLEGNTYLTKVKLNTSTSSIGANAFKGATMLESLDNVTRSTRAVAGLDLSTYTNLSSIGADAFSGTSFTGITKGKLPAKVSSIGPGAFSNMSALASADISNLTSLTNIPERLFNGDNQLATIKLPTNVTSIGNEAFKGTGLTDLNSLNTLTNLESIGNGAFSNARLANNINNLPTSITLIGNEAFSGNNGITTINLSNLSNLKYIGSKVFANISGLQSLDLLGTKITHLPAEFLANSGGQNAGGGGVPYLSRYKQARPAPGANNFTLTLPNTITTIDTNAFKNFKGQNIDLGQIYIDNPTFTPNLEGNDNLTSLSVPHGVTVINTNIVDQAPNLTTLTLPGTAVNWNQSSMSEIEPNAVTKLNEVVFNVAPLEDKTKATGFDSINWEQVADIASMFTTGQYWNQKYTGKTILPNLVSKGWKNNSNNSIDLNDSINTSVTKSMNDLTWTYNKTQPNPMPYTNKNPYATITARERVFFKATNGNAYSFGLDNASSKQITIKINLYAK